MNLRARFFLCLASVSLLCAGGCSIIPEAKPDPTRFFVLEDVAPDSTDNATTTGVTIGLLPITVPAYLLNNRAIAVMTADHEITYRTFERWAEPLDEGVSRVLRATLVKHAQISRVETPPFPITRPRDYELKVSVIECTGIKDGPIRFTIAYALTHPNGDLQRQGTFTAPTTSWSGDSGDLAAQLSVAISAAAHAIANELP